MATVDFVVQTIVQHEVMSPRPVPGHLDALAMQAVHLLTSVELRIGATTCSGSRSCVRCARVASF